MLKSELAAYWDWELSSETVDATIDKYFLQKISLLRAFCQRTGVQVRHHCVVYDEKVKTELLYFVVTDFDEGIRF